MTKEQEQAFMEMVNSGAPIKCSDPMALCSLWFELGWASVLTRAGKRGGASKSKSKSEASKRNGKLGGRPKKNV